MPGMDTTTTAIACASSFRVAVDIREAAVEVEAIRDGLEAAVVVVDTVETAVADAGGHQHAGLNSVWLLAVSNVKGRQNTATKLGFWACTC